MRTLIGFSSSMLCEVELRCVCVRVRVCVCSSCISKAWRAGGRFAWRRWESIPRGPRLISAPCISTKWFFDFDTVTSSLIEFFSVVVFVVKERKKKKRHWVNVLILDTKDSKKWDMNGNWDCTFVCSGNFVTSAWKMCFIENSFRCRSAVHFSGEI